MTPENQPGPGRIELAHAPDFEIGGLTVRPGVRQIVDADGQSEIVEPRVMQVLVALWRAQGGIVTRDELTMSCWEGRVVGEDAINRVISRLRRVAEGPGQGHFRIETITKVGYRLIGGADPPGAHPLHGDSASGRAAPISRRALVAGGFGLGALAIGAGVWRWIGQRPSIPPSVATLVTQADLALQQDSADGTAQAIGLYRHIVDVEPKFADGWGGLAFAYAIAAHQAPAPIVDQMSIRAREAAARANAIEPENAYAEAALATLRPRRGNWLAEERSIRHALDVHAGNPRLQIALAMVLLDVGRMRDAAALIVRAIAAGTPSPVALYSRTGTLWSANQFDAADRSADEMIALYPRHVGVWFTRCYLLLFTGRADEAIAMIDSRGSRPPGIPDSDFEITRVGAVAVRSRAAADIDNAMRVHIEAAHHGSGYANNAMRFAAALGRLDDAFMLANAIYFGRPFDPGELFFTEQQAAYVARGNRPTDTLFEQPTAPMRRDARFEPLMQRLGIARYWQQSGSQPDYRLL